MGIIHRDFKPANLVFVKKEDPNTMFLIDFGIAKIGYTDVPSNYSNCGTNNYKAP
jgi:calcium-dependent protein kinase